MATSSVFNLTRFTALAAGDILCAVDVSDNTQSANGSLDSITVTNFFASIPAPVNVTSASATALAVGRLGATTPAFTVDASTGSQVAGLKVTGAATGGTVAVVVTDSGSNANLIVNAKGSGTIGIGTVSTGAVTITPNTTIGGTLGVTGALTALNATIGATGAYNWTGRGAIGAAADGVFTLYDNAGTSFGRLQFGGTTSSFPALKRSGPAMLVRLADDSDYASLFCGPLTVAGAVSGITTLAGTGAISGFTTAVFSSTVTATAFIGGGTVATTGLLRVANAAIAVCGRNALNNADVALMLIGGDNSLELLGNVLNVSAAGVGTFAGAVVVAGAPSTAGVGAISIGGSVQTTVGAAGAASALPATPEGFVRINVAGTERLIPFYIDG